MASNTKENIDKIMAARMVKVKIDELEFQKKQQDQKIERLRQQVNNLSIENEKLKKQLGL
jgi:uncharacterized coiled-coil protein SlyX